jgi:hypothetical protein
MLILVLLTSAFLAALIAVIGKTLYDLITIVGHQRQHIGALESTLKSQARTIDTHYDRLRTEVKVIDAELGKVSGRQRNTRTDLDSVLVKMKGLL